MPLRPLLPGDKVLCLPPNQPRRDGGTQFREGTDPRWVQRMAEQLDAGEDLTGGEHDLDPIVAFWDGKEYWLAHGFHRTAAYESRGAKRIEFLVRQGTLRDARLYAAGCNAKGRLARSLEDARRAARFLLADDEWSLWSDRKIATHCGVSPTSVGNYRRELVAEKCFQEEEAKRLAGGKKSKKIVVQNGHSPKSPDPECNGFSPPDLSEYDEDEEAFERVMNAVNPARRKMDDGDVEEKETQIRRSIIKFIRHAGDLGLTPMEALRRYFPRAMPAEH